MEDLDHKQQRLMAEIIQRMAQLDFPHLAILNAQLGEHMFNCLQYAEIERNKRAAEAEKLH